MAESFALGLTKTVVEGTVITVKSAIEEERKLRDDVQHDLEFITAEFQMMQSFLNNVGAGGQSEVVRTWVRLLRDLAFDVEDWVEFVSHLDVKSSAWWWRMLPACLLECLERTQDLDLAAAEIKLLKARVESISRRSKRYSYNLVTGGDASSAGGGSRSIPKPPAAAATAMPAEQVVAGAAVSALAFGILRKVWEAAGKPCGGKFNLQELIPGEGSCHGELRVISVWGSTGGDLGMTSAIREAYCDAKICQEFTNRAWVKLAAHPSFDLDDVVDSLRTQLRRTSSRRADEDVLQDKYLVVLQDVSTVVQWDGIRMYLQDYNNGSRIVVSTHDIGMAFLCTGKPYLVSELRRFPDGHSLCAFFRKAPVDVHKSTQEITWPSVMSVWGSSRTKSVVMDQVYRGQKVKFETYGWVHMPDYYWFDFKLISRQLYLDLCSTGGSVYNETKHATETVDAIGETLLIQKCCEFLREKDCLVVIDGLRSEQDWDLFRQKFLSEPVKGCIIVITNEENVAKYCVHPREDRAYPEARAAEYFGYRDSLHEFFSIRKEKARNWTKTAKIVESHQGLALSFSLLLENPGVVSVWGLAGVGKSYLIRTIYYRHMLRLLGQLFTPNNQHVWLDIRNDLFTEYSWVSVPHPFSLMTFSRRLLMDFYSENLEAMETAAVGIMQGQDLYEECRKILSRGKYFVVIDGIWFTDEWDMIKQAYFSRGVDGCVVVIAHEAKVARHCQADEERRVNVKAFQDDEAHNLFMEVVWKNEQPAPNDMELSKRILSKCGGLPKIISAIGECYRPLKSSTSQLDLLKHINDDFIGSSGSNNQGFHRRLRSLFSWMKYYFDSAFSDTLKPCIFYLLVFPVNQNIRRRRLLRRWIAEGYCRDKAFTTVEEEGKKLLSELTNLSIIQVQHTAREILKLNGFFREYLVSTSMEGNLVFALEGNCTVNSQRKGQHLTIRRSWDRDRIVFESIDFSRLRSLTVSGEWRPFFVCADNNMRLLRVLDLEDTVGLTDDDLGKIVKLLQRLKFLSLRGCRKITCLPDSLGGLRQLHTLDVMYTSILALPLDIIKLEKLQYINAGTTKSWDLTSPPEAASESTSQEENIDGTVSSLRVPAADEVGTSTSQEENIDGTVSSLRVPAADEVGTSTPPPPCSSRARQLVSGCCLAKFHRCRQARDHNGSIKVPAGIGKLTALQTLGVVNVCGAGGKAVSKELKKLTQLRKLRVSGISKKNYQELFSAITAHAHLESLSVRLEMDQDGGFCCLDDIPEPPMNLKSLKMYGHVHRLPTWMKQLDRLSKVDLEMTISAQHDTHFYEQLPNQTIHGRISVKAVEMDRVHFRAPKYPFWTKPFQVFKIDCTSWLEVTFTDDYITRSVELLVVQFSSGSSVRISGLQDLHNLKEVWLKGSYSLELWRQLKQQLSEHPRKPVLKPERVAKFCLIQATGTEQ